MLQEALIALNQKLKEACARGLCQRFALIGGLAVSARGYVRSTQDIDFLVDVDEKQCGALAQFLGGIFIAPDLGDPLEGVVRIEAGNILAQLIRLSPRLTEIGLGDLSDVLVEKEPIPVIGAMGLVILKLYAGSDGDLEDARQLLLAQNFTPFDLEHLKKLAIEFHLEKGLEDVLR